MAPTRKTQKLQKSSSSSASNVSGNKKSSSPSRPPSLASFKRADRQTKNILEMLRHSIYHDEMALMDENAVNEEAHAFNINRVIEENRRKKQEEEDDEDEIASNSIDKQDELRLSHLEETRPRWLTFSLKFFFHVLVFMNFFVSWFDSARILLEDAKMNLWQLEDDFNCLEIVNSVDVIDHIINILHALLCVSVIYVHKRNSATLCLAWVTSQAIHTIFKTFQYFYNLKFEKRAFDNLSGLKFLIFIVAFNSLGSLLLIHKYYDLTDRFKTRAKYFGTTDTDERSLNDKIIYKNDTSFIQRKSILREVTMSQTYAIIQKIGKHAKQGLHVDPLSLDREVNAARLALADCADADNQNMIYMLKKAYAHRLKELEDQQGEVILGMFGKNSSTIDSNSNPPIIQSQDIL